MKTGVCVNLTLRFLITVVFLTVWYIAPAQNQAVKVTPGGTYYYEYLPPDYNSNTNNYPIVFFLHGLGERGDTETSLTTVARNGPPKHVKNGFKFPFILISPQLKTRFTGWPNSYIDAVIEHCKTYLRVDLSRVYLTGLSLGGGGTWGYSQDAVLGQKLAAVAVVCGHSNNLAKACNFGLTNLPVWAFHGDADGTVSVNKTLNMVAAINACNPAPNPLAKMTIYPGVNHNSWDRAYLTDNSLHTPNVYQWLLQFKNGGIIVNAGADKTINLPTNSTTISGLATVENATISNYVWTKVSGPTVTMANTTTPTLSLTNLVQGVYSFRLTSTASNGETAYDEVKVTVISSNQTPLANAGTDVSITLPTNALTLTGTGTDADGTIASYAWTKVSGPAATLSGATTASLSLSNLLQGTYVFSLTVTDNGGSTGSDQVSVTVNAAAVNQAPVANAGTDKSINLPLNTITINGIGSDADGSVTGYLWEKVTGPAATLTNTTSASLTASALISGVYIFRLTVTDNLGAKGSDDVTVSVVAANQSPAANAGPDLTLTLPTNSTNLNGSGSDADGSVASYTWTQVSGPSSITIANPASATASIAALIEGTYVFRLTVSDNLAATSFDDVSVVVKAAVINSLPVANAGPDITLNLPSNSTTLAGSGSDADGSISSYQWTKISGPSAVTGNTTSAILSLSELVEGIYEFQLFVTDNSGGTASDIAIVTVVNSNQSPSANAGADVEVTLPNSSAVITGSGSDPDGSVVAYEWTKVSGPAGVILANETTNTLTLTGLVEGTYVFSLQVKDNLDATDTDELTVTVNTVAVNIPPVVNAGTDRQITLPTNTITLNATASDADGTIASYFWSLVNGPACTLSQETTQNLNVSSMQAGSYVFRITVTDNNGAAASDNVAVTVQPETVNQSPVAQAGGDITLILPNNTTVINGTGTDADGSIATYLWVKTSGGAATLSGENTQNLTLSNLAAGVYSFELTVTDDKGSIGTDNVTVFVNALNSPPVALGGSDITLNLPTNTTVVAGSGTDADGTISSYAWTQISGPSTATVSGENTSSLTLSNLLQGTYIIQLTVTDNDGATGTDEVKIVVNAAANLSPTANAGANKNITLPTATAIFNGNGTDADGTIASYSWTQLNGPTTATLSNSSTKTLTVTVVDAGTYNFRLTVTDNAGATAFDDVRLIVNAAIVNQPPVANAGSGITIQLPVNTANLTGSGTDPDGSIATYAWIKVSGPAATLSNANTNTLAISGLVEGSYVFRLTVTDNGGLTGSATVSVNVLPELINLAPVANAGVNRSITLPTNSLNITGSGSDPDGSIANYVWTKVSGGAATLSNTTQAVLSISALEAGTYVFRLTVTDDKGATGSDDVSLIVNAATVNQAPVANAGIDKSLSLPANTLSVTGIGSDADGSISVYLWTKVSGPSVTIAGANTVNMELSDLVQGTYVFRLTVTDNGGLTASDEVQIIVLPATVNQIPVANAGADMAITLPLDNITLFGLASDPDGTVLTYAWTQISGPAAVLTNAGTPTLSIATMVAGTYVFRLSVTDDEGANDTDDVTVLVNPEFTNQLPVANAGADQNITLPTNIATITGSGSDSDGSIAVYTWVKVSGPAVTLGAINQPVLSASDLVEGTYIFRLEVEDNAGGKDTDDVSINVRPSTVNASPVVNAGADVLITEPATSATINGTATDPDGTVDLRNWTQVAGTPATISVPSSLITDVTGLAVGTYRFRLTATDDKGASAFDEVTVTVNSSTANQLPFASAGEDINIKLPLTSVTITGAGTDQDGTISSFLWEKVSGPTVTIAGQSTTTLALTNLIEGTYTFRLIVTDDAGGADEDLVVVTVLPSDINVPPVVDAGPDQAVELPETTITITGVLEDDDDLALLTVLWTKVSGPAVSMTGTNQAVLSLSNLQEGTYVFRLAAADDGGLSDFDEVVVTVFPQMVLPDPPVVSAGDDITITLPENSVNIDVTADSPNGLIVSYTWVQVDGASLVFDPNSTNRLALENLVAGNYRFQVTVTDAEGRSASDDVILIVREENPEVVASKLFSPDQNDVNETWLIENPELLNDCEIQVFNRQGQKVYESLGYPIPWNGTFNGNPVPDGAYFYVIRCGGKVSKSGSVTIARLK